jgi:hypothetical protein
VSAAAEIYARTVLVKGSARALLEALAQLIPEGQTTTPLIGMDALADRARCTRRTVLTQLQVLVEAGELEVVDGGSGRIARYTLVHVDGARPMTPAPLPLLGTAPPPRVSRPSTSPSSSTPDLFDLPAPSTSGDQTAINLRNFFTGWVREPVIFFHRLLGGLATPVKKLRRFTRAERSNGDQPAQKDHRLTPIERSDREEPVKKDHRLADVVRTTTTTSTTTARETTNAPTCGPWHAWCGGRVHVPKNQHKEFLRRLSRQPGETDAALEARAFACYAAELATIPDDQSIAIKSEFDFWRPRFATMLAAAAPVRRDPTIHQVAAGDVWADVLRVIDLKVNRHAFHSWFVPTALVEDRGSVIVIAGPAAHGDLFVDWIEKHYGDVVREAVEAVRPGTRIEFVRQQRKSG